MFNTVQNSTSQFLRSTVEDNEGITSFYSFRTDTTKTEIEQDRPPVIDIRDSYQVQALFYMEDGLTPKPQWVEMGFHTPIDLVNSAIEVLVNALDESFNSRKLITGQDIYTWFNENKPRKGVDLSDEDIPNEDKYETDSSYTFVRLSPRLNAFGHSLKNRPTGRTNVRYDRPRVYPMIPLGTITTQKGESRLIVLSVRFAERFNPQRQNITWRSSIDAEGNETEVCEALTHIVGVSLMETPFSFERFDSQFRQLPGHEGIYLQEIRSQATKVSPKAFATAGASRKPAPAPSSSPLTPNKMSPVQDVFEDEDSDFNPAG